MYYSIRHVTRFRYSAPITESAMEVRMQPRREGGQHCLSFELTTDPRAQIMSSRDYLGNIVHHFDIPGRHTQLTINAQALVSVAAPQPPGATPAGSWVELDALVTDSDSAEMLIPSQFAQPTPALRELADELGLRRRSDPLSTLYALNAALHGALTYTPRSTGVHSPIDDALRQRRGVCQDYAHIMIALARELGIPCRYVSGYLYRPAAERADADATHAWVEALLPGAGWVGFDPTNDTLAGAGHIRTAIGRDYADVPPTRGVFKGDAHTELGVAVQVVPADETFADDELLLVMKRLSPPDHDGEQPEQQQQAQSETGEFEGAAPSRALFHHRLRVWCGP
jgi:transglutaminase-like putative cysteine protease